MQEVGNATNPLRQPLARQGALFGMILIIMMRMVTMIMMRWKMIVMIYTHWLWRWCKSGNYDWDDDGGNFANVEASKMMKWNEGEDSSFVSVNILLKDVWMCAQSLILVFSWPRFWPRPELTLYSAAQLFWNAEFCIFPAVDNSESSGRLASYLHLKFVQGVFFRMVPPQKVLRMAKSLPKSESGPLQQQDVKF